MSTTVRSLNELNKRVDVISNPNLLINGDFSVWQRGTSFTGGGFGTDRWRTFSGSQTQQVVNGGFNNIVNNVGANGNQFLTPIEIDEDFGNKTYTMSFKVSASSLYTFDYVGILIKDLINPNIDVISGAIPITTTPDVYSVTLNVGDLSSLDLNQPNARAEIVFRLTNGSNTNVTFEWVKLEEGSVATPFVPDDPATNLIKCQRYYWKANLFGYSMRTLVVGSYASNSIQYPVRMRVIPTTTSIIEIDDAPATPDLEDRSDEVYTALFTAPGLVCDFVTFTADAEIY